MNPKLVRAFAIGVCAFGAATMANAQQSTPAGQSVVNLSKYEYEARCAVCHGLKGEGDGPYANFVMKPVSNLTILSKSNGGVFPFTRVYETIDGTVQLTAHGPKDMPIWGREYRGAIISGMKGMDFVPYIDPESFARARILALTEYIYTLQAK
jgi:mono/diheme cytochrome c family protein